VVCLEGRQAGPLVLACSGTGAAAAILAFSRPNRPPPAPPPFLLQPHLKLNAAMGCLARMPLPPLRGFSFPHASLEPLEPHGGSSSSGSRAAHARQASTSSLMSRASYSSQLAEAWQPYFK